MVFETYYLTLAYDLQDKRILMLSLKDIVRAALNNIDTGFIIVDKGNITIEGQSKTCLALVVDEIAAVHSLLWGEE